MLHDRFRIEHCTLQIERDAPRGRRLLLMTVTHLECSLTGERYEAGQVHNLSRGGQAAAGALRPRGGAADADPRQPRARASRACGNGASCCRTTASRSASASPRRRSFRCRTAPAGANLLVKDEGRLPTGSFKARGLAMAVTMAKQFGIERIAMPTNGNAGAALAAYGARAGIETIVICPAETPEINVTETAAYGARVYVADGQIDECGALVGEGRGAGPVVRLLDPEGAVPPRGQEGDGLRAGRAARLGAARRDLLPDRRRHRPDRHVEGVRRAGGGRA